MDALHVPVYSTRRELQWKARLVIIDIDEFPNRKGKEFVDKDAAMAHQAFQNLGKYDIHRYHLQNINAARLKEILNEEANSENLKNCEAYICMLMMGCDGKLLQTMGHQRVDVKEVFEPFKDVPNLNGKPKVFFFYTSGRGQMEGVEADSVEFDAQVCTAIADLPPAAAAELPATIQVPAEADFLSMHCNVPGFTSFVDTRTGRSYFIEALSEAVEEHADTMDLVTLLTKVTHSMTIGKHKPPEGKFQVPKIESTLTKRFYLSPEVRTCQDCSFSAVPDEQSNLVHDIVCTVRR